MGIVVRLATRLGDGRAIGRTLVRAAAVRNDRTDEYATVSPKGGRVAKRVLVRTTAA